MTQAYFCYKKTACLGLAWTAVSGNAHCECKNKATKPKTLTRQYRSTECGVVNPCRGGLKDWVMRRTCKRCTVDYKQRVSNPFARIRKPTQGPRHKFLWPSRQKPDQQQTNEEFKSRKESEGMEKMWKRQHRRNMQIGFVYHSGEKPSLANTRRYAFVADHFIHLQTAPSL